MLLLLGLRQSEVWRRQVRDLDLDGTVLRISGAKTETGNRAVEVPEVLQPLLRALAVDRLPSAPLFAAADGGHHTKSWLRAAVRRVCDRAGVTQVTPHGLRGTFSTLAQSAGAQGHVVAAQLGHASVSTTREHYTDAETVQAAEQRRALSVIEGGKR